MAGVAMRVELFTTIPPQAMEIRQRVFVEEQGFQVEFDEMDAVAVHFVAFDDFDTPVATCRVFKGEESNTYILGRLAVSKESRGKNAGRFLVEKVEKYVKAQGGVQLQLHAQCRITAFYERLGFSPFGEIDDDEGLAHIWMKKML